MHILIQYRIEPYCSVLNNRPLLIIIRGDNQSIKRWLFGKQRPSLYLKLISHWKLGICPKFELLRTETIEFRTKWNFIWANVPNSHTGLLLSTLQYLERTKTFVRGFVFVFVLAHEQAIRFFFWIKVLRFSTKILAYKELPLLDITSQLFLAFASRPSIYFQVLSPPTNFFLNITHLLLRGQYFNLT